jgi:hypothetical protein
MTQGQGRDPMAAVDPRQLRRSLPSRPHRRPASHTSRAFSLGATLASLSLLPRRTLLGARQPQSTCINANFEYAFAGGNDHDPYFQELAASAPQKRNWRGILTAFAMIIFISSIILAAIFFLTPCEFSKAFGYWGRILK